MAINTPRSKFMHELSDIYDAEHQFLAAQHKLGWVIGQLACYVLAERSRSVFFLLGISFGRRAARPRRTGTGAATTGSSLRRKVNSSSRSKSFTRLRNAPHHPVYSYPPARRGLREFRRAQAGWLVDTDDSGSRSGPRT